ncbi:unnamed protein product [Moneuplotes crassus]|uniref:Uncharacterized protein n=1 Tax=Euplotes crassus TaxID=5936 RepID=A0AAD1UPI2_EUPCR|nr:unnamed protein product [Moneuplotes crassus]
MGCQASDERKPNKKNRSRRPEGHCDIQVLQFDDKVDITDIELPGMGGNREGIACRTKQGKTFLPGQQNSYKVLKEYGITKVFLKREKAEEMAGEIQVLIDEKEAEKKEIEHEIEAGNSFDPKKGVVVRDIQNIISDFQRVLGCIQDGNNNHSNEENDSFDNDNFEDERREGDDWENTPIPIQKYRIEGYIRKHNKDMADAYNEDGRLRLILNNSKHIKIIEELLDNLDGYILPDCSTLGIELVGYNSDKAYELLSNHFPKKVKHFWFKNLEPEEDITRYWSILESINSQGIYQLVLSKFHVPTDILGKIFGCFSQVKFLTFWYCTLEGQEVEISNQIEFKIEHIIFKNCGEPAKSDWNNHPQHLWGIIEAIGKSNLKNSLKSCRFKNDPEVEITLNNIQEIFESNGMADVKVYEAIYGNED